MALFAFYFAHAALNALQANEGTEKFVLAKMIGHGLLTFAFIWFCYQLLRVGERMSIPHWWLKNSRALHVLLGVQHPTEHVRPTLEMMKTAMQMMGKGEGKE